MSQGPEKKPFPFRVTSAMRRHIRNGVAAAGMAGTLLAASPAAADDFFADAGVYLGYTWGSGGGFTWGVEARAGTELRDEFACTADPAAAFAATARLEFVDLDRLHLWAGGQSGVTLGLLSMMADLGVGYRFGEDGGLSVPIAFDLQVHAARTFVGYDATLNDGFAGAGVRLPPPDRQFGCAVAGRALHAEDGHAELPGAWTLAELRAASEREREVVSEWGHRARTEWASVPAFLQLADQLLRANAPRPLVARALKAADDELRHAEMSARVAVHHGDAPLALGAVTPDTRAPAQGLDALRRLAAESWVDGCLGEGKAAAAAAIEASHAESAGIRSVSSAIARDEAAHAELAWDVLGWAVTAGGDDVRHAVWSVREAQPTEASGSRSDLDLSAYGLLSEADHDRIGQITRERAAERLEHVLG